MDYKREHNIKIKIVRIFNTYGPKMGKNDGRVISNFINQALTNKDLTVFGEGKQTRSFQYIDDLVEGLIKVMNSDDNFTGPVNIGNPDEFTINSLAKTIIDLTKSNSKILHQDLPEDDPKMRKPDITLAKLYLGWNPKIDLLTGLKETIKYYSNIKNNL